MKIFVTRRLMDQNTLEAARTGIKIAWKTIEMASVRMKLIDLHPVRITNKVSGLRKGIVLRKKTNRINPAAGVGYEIVKVRPR